jgi:ACS family tartrate transporter-like MFS transporter
LHAPPGSATSTPSISCEALLGAAEAGFFPGIIFYLTLWFPTEYRARIVGYFTAAILLSTVIGAPISGLLLYFHGGLGLAGWQWLFIIEAVPAIIPSFSPASSSSI